MLRMDALGAMKLGTLGVRTFIPFCFYMFSSRDVVNEHNHLVRDRRTG